MDELKRYQWMIMENFRGSIQVRDIKFLARGKDHTVCLVNSDMIFRFPNHRRAEEKLRKEIALLKQIESRLPLAIPHFRLISKTPSVFVGYERAPGKPLQLTPGIWDVAWWQSAVGDFLTALHRISIRNLIVGTTDELEQFRFHAECPAECWQNIAAFYALVQERVFSLINERQRQAIARYFAAYLDNPAHFDYEPVLLHADLHLGHILGDVERQTVTGIIDFSDMQIGDPTRDMRNAWEPYYQGDRGSAWDARRDFYWRSRWLGDIVYKEELIEANPRVVEEALTMINALWPPEREAI